MPPEKLCVDVCLVLKPRVDKEHGGYVLEAYDARQAESTPPLASATLSSLSSLDSGCLAGALQSILNDDSYGLQQMGDYLAGWLFVSQPGITPNPVGAYLQERLAHIKRPQSLRVWLRFDQALLSRWEVREGFIPFESLEHNSIVPVSVLRGVVHGASTSQPLEIPDKLRVLMVYANPAEDKAPPGSRYPHLRALRQHFDLLCRTLEPLVFEEALFREVLHSPTPEQLQEALTRLNPHVLVFVGHGYSTDGGGLVCVRNGAPEEWAFPKLVQAIRASQEPALRLGVFMACRSFVAAPSLLTSDVPVVLAMQPLADTDFPEQSVPVFAESFFRVLAYLGPISDAYVNACRALASSELPFAALMPTLWLATPHDIIFASPEERRRAKYMDALLDKLSASLPPSLTVAREANFSTVYVDQSGIEERQTIHTAPVHDFTPAAQATEATAIQGGIQRKQVDLWKALRAYHRVVLVDPVWTGKDAFYQGIAQQCFEQTRWLPIVVNLRDFVRRQTTLRQYLERSYAELLGLKGDHFEVRLPNKKKQLRSVGRWLHDLWQAGEALLILDAVDTEVTTELNDKALRLLPTPRLSAIRPYVLLTSDVLGKDEVPPGYKLAHRKPTKNLFLSYDLEDRSEVRELVTALRGRGIAVTWDQDWPGWSNFGAEIERAIRQADDVLLYSTNHARHSRWIEDEMTLAQREKARGRLIVLDREARNRCALVAHEEGLDIAGLTPDEAAEVVIRRLNPERHPVNLPVTSGTSVAALLQDALEANLGIPSDAITDKIFVSPEAGRLTEAAYTKAEDDGLLRKDPNRLRAALEYAHLKRFRGEWDQAMQTLQLHIEAARDDAALYPIYCLELGALQFECGITDMGIRLVRSALEAIQDSGVTATLVKVLRQLGNMLEEQGGWEEASNHLNAAVHLSKYIKYDADNEAEKSRLIVVKNLIMIDCLRERASLVLKKDSVDEGLRQFHSALEATEDKAMLKAGEYLQGVLRYHLGRGYLLYKRDVRRALEYLHTGLHILRKYDNPVRLAFLYDNIGRAMTEQYPPGDLREAQLYLAKARRIRERCHHEYMIANMELNLGALHWQKRAPNAAIAAYQKARAIYARLGKTDSLGDALLALGTTYARIGRRTAAVDALKKAKTQFQHVQSTDRIREVEFELFKLRSPGGLDGPLPALVQRGKAELYDFALNEVGEYTLHQWIKQVTKEKRVPRPEVVVPIGVGDDAAVMRIRGADLYDLVLTTDAAPGSLCRSTALEMGRYAAQFSVIHSLSDVLAMGATPVAVLLNLYLRRDARLEYAMQVIETVIDEASKYNTMLIGGDLKEREEQSVGCVGIGIVKRGQAIKRDRARPGHVVALTLAGMPDGHGVRKVGCRWAQEVIEHLKLDKEPVFQEFCQRDWKRELLFLPYKAMLAGASTGLIKSAIDTSDGVLACLEILGRESQVGFVLDEERIEHIIDERVKEIALHLGFRPVQFLFNAGHDWEIMLTVAEEDFPALQTAFRNAGGDLARLGTVCERTEPLTKGVAFSRQTGEKVWIPFFTDEKFVRQKYEQRPWQWEELKFFVEGGQKLV